MTVSLRRLHLLDTAEAGPIIGVVRGLALNASTCGDGRGLGSFGPDVCTAVLRGEVKCSGSALGRDVEKAISVGCLGFSPEVTCTQEGHSRDGQRVVLGAVLTAVAVTGRPAGYECYAEGVSGFWPIWAGPASSVEVLREFSLPEGERRGLALPTLKSWANGE